MSLADRASRAIEPESSMFTPIESRKTLPYGGPTCIDDRLGISLSLDDLPDRPGARHPLPPEIRDLIADPLLEWSEVGEPLNAESLLDDDVPVVELTGEWEPTSDPLF
jgi:hypothetical protein